MGCKAAETTCNINNAFDPGTANERALQWWFKQFCKGDESLEDEEPSGRPSETDNNPLRGSLTPTLIQLHEKLSKNSTSTVLWSFNIWSKLERWKSSISGCLMSWLKIKKIIVLKCRLLLSYATTMNHFLIRLWCAIKSRFYTITGDNQLSGWTEKKLQSTSQSQTCTQKRVMVTGSLLPVWSTIDLEFPVRPSHVRRMLSKLIRCSESCNTCSWHWSAKRAQFLSTTARDHASHNQCFTSWTNWPRKFCLVCHVHLSSHQPSTTSSSILTTFCRENTSTTSRRKKTLSKSWLNPEAQIFMLQNKQIYFLLAKMCWL